MKESKRGRKRKRAFGDPSAAVMDDQEEQENTETTQNDLKENIEANETVVVVRTESGAESSGADAESISDRVLVDVTNWQVERSPLGDMFVSPNGQMLSKEYAWDWVSQIMKNVSRRK